MVTLLVELGWLCVRDIVGALGIARSKASRYTGTHLM
jgi:hypothetical protein